MPTAFITVWDSFTNSEEKLYVEVDFRKWSAPSGKEIVLHAYTAEVIRDVVCANSRHGVKPWQVETDPRAWSVRNVHKPDDEHLFVVVESTRRAGRFQSYAVRWHY
jgi:hypothetical protein